MKRWKRFTTVAAATGVAATLAFGTFADEWTRVVPDDVGMSSDRLQRLTDVMQAYIDDGDIAGMVVLVARDGKVPYEKAFGYRDLESKSPMQEDTIFRIASQTKAIVTTGIMMLMEEGKILVTDPVGNYLPEFMHTKVAVPNGSGGYDVVPADRPITIRDLLTHTSGIPYGAWQNDLTADAWNAAGFPGWYFANKDQPIREVVRKMADLPMNAQPGTKWIYGYNLDILGAVVEVVSGETLDKFLKERIFDPLGMVDTQFYLPQNEADRLATVYDRSDDGTLTRSSDEGAMGTQGQYIIGQGPNVTFSGGAGLLSTAHDYSVFLEMLLNGGKTMSGEQLLSPTTVDLMTTDHLDGIPFRQGAGFGYGFQIATDQGALGYPGAEGEFRWGGAYHSTYWVDPVNKLVVTAFTQFGPTGGLDDQNKLRNLIYQAIVK